MLSERDQRDLRNFCEPFEPREERSDEGGSATCSFFLMLFLGRVRWNFDGFDCFADFGMRESIPRNRCSRVRQRMERRQTIESVTDEGKPCGHLARGTSASGGSVTPRGEMLKPEILKVEIKKANRKPRDGSPPRGAQRRDPCRIGHPLSIYRRSRCERASFKLASQTRLPCLPAR